jgi:V8-like Glu-specific endopeptidase
MKYSIAVAIGLLACLSAGAHAQVASPAISPTAARILTPDPNMVQPMPLPQVGEETPTAPETEKTQADRRGPGLPSRPPDPNVTQMPQLKEWLNNQPDPPQQPESQASKLRPLAVNQNGWRFTTSRVFPQAALLYYPYSTIGRIFLQDSQGNLISCSGTVIQLRLVLTAGHCVYDPANNQFYQNWTFYPIYYDGSSPVGPWAAVQAFTTPQWANGHGSLPNSADFGILVLADQQGISIGQVTGWLGIQTGLYKQQFKQIGYPGNLDGGERPQETSALVAVVQNTDFRWGSNQAEGSSGSSLILNFGENADGQNFLANQVIGVVSFGNSTRGVVGSSKFTTNILSLIAGACSADPGNCN